MEKSKNEYLALRREIARQLRGRVLFWVSLGLYFFYLLTLLARQYPPPSHPMLLLLFVWTGVLVVQGLRTFRLWGRWIDRAVQKELIRRGAIPPVEGAYDEKPKRAARLTADGEIEYEDESERLVRQKQGGSH
jgi:hypothetical protein